MSGNNNLVGDITIFVSPDNSIKKVDQSIINLLQYTEEQLIGKPINLYEAEFMFNCTYYNSIYHFR